MTFASSSLPFSVHHFTFRKRVCEILERTTASNARRLLQGASRCARQMCAEPPALARSQFNVLSESCALWRAAVKRKYWHRHSRIAKPQERQASTGSTHHQTWVKNSSSD